MWNHPWNSSAHAQMRRAGRRLRGDRASVSPAGPACRRLEAYNQAIAIDPTDPNAFVGRGDVLADRNALRRGDRRLRPGDPAWTRSHSRAFASRGIALLSPGPRRGGARRPRPRHRAGPGLRQGVQLPGSGPRPAGAERPGAGRLRRRGPPPPRERRGVQGPRRRPVPAGSVRQCDPRPGRGDPAGSEEGDGLSEPRRGPQRHGPVTNGPSWTSTRRSGSTRRTRGRIPIAGWPTT